MRSILQEIKNTSIVLEVIFSGLSLIFLGYLLWPGPGSIDDFPQLTSSTRSSLSGDTVEVPNIVGYFSNNYRDKVLSFYSQSYQKLSHFPFPALRLNYPPEQAFVFVKDQTQSTFLEERTYPLRDSLFINGMEPFYQDGKAKYWGSTKFSESEMLFETKTTLRYYPSPIWARVIIWFGVCFSIILIWILGKKIITKDI